MVARDYFIGGTLLLGIAFLIIPLVLSSDNKKGNSRKEEGAPIIIILSSHGRWPTETNSRKEEGESEPLAANLVFVLSFGSWVLCLAWPLGVLSSPSSLFLTLLS